MPEPLETVAIILAAGGGTRSGLDYPKQFLRLGGLTVLEHTLTVFSALESISRIVVVGPEGWLDETRDAVLASGVTKVIGVIPGGRTRNGSTQAALRFLAEEQGIQECKLLIHDAVRPLVAPATLTECIEVLDAYDAADVVIETADTIVEVDGGVLSGIPTRSRLRRGQTPQAFKLSTLRDAYAALSEDVLERFTDDCAVVMRAFPERKIAAVTGSEENIKLTRPIDIYLADRLLQGRQTRLPDRNRDRRTMPGTVVVIGGSSGIGAAIVDVLAAEGVRAVPLSRSAGGVDVRDEAGVRAALDAVRVREGEIGAVINSAGILTRGPLMELGAAEIEDEIAVNLRGAINVARAAHPHLKETRGHLILFTSSSYTRGRAGYGAYSATKAGIVNVTQALSEEWLHDQIKVNCINPGRTETPMRSRAFGIEADGSLLSAQRVAVATVDVLRREMTGHVFDVRLRE